MPAGKIYQATVHPTLARVRSKYAGMRKKSTVRKVARIQRQVNYIKRSFEHLTSDQFLAYTAPAVSTETLDVTWNGLYQQNTNNPMNGTGIFRCITTSVGDALGQRTGNTLFLNRLIMNLDFTLPQPCSIASARVRWFLFKYNPNAEFSPDNDTFYTAPFLGTVNMSFAMRNILKKSTAKVIKSGSFQLTNTFTGSVALSSYDKSAFRKTISKTIRFPQGLKMVWNNVADSPGGVAWNNSDYCNTNHLYFVAYTEHPNNVIATDTVTVRGIFRAYYTDA